MYQQNIDVHELNKKLQCFKLKDRLRILRSMMWNFHIGKVIPLQRENAGELLDLYEAGEISYQQYRDYEHKIRPEQLYEMLLEHGRPLNMTCNSFERAYYRFPLRVSVIGKDFWLHPAFTSIWARNNAISFDSKGSFSSPSLRFELKAIDYAEVDYSYSGSLAIYLK